NPPAVTAPHRSATTTTASAQSRQGAVVGETGRLSTPEVSESARRSPAELDEPIRPSLAAVILPHDRLSVDLNQAEPSQTAGRTMHEPVARQTQAEPAGPPARVQ